MATDTKTFAAHGLADGFASVEPPDRYLVRVGWQVLRPARHDFPPRLRLDQDIVLFPPSVPYPGTLPRPPPTVNSVQKTESLPSPVALPASVLF